MTHSLPQDQLVKHQPPRRQAGSSPWIEKATTISKVLGKDFWSTWVHKMGHWALTHAVLSFINIHTSRSFNRHCTKCKDALGAVGSVVRYYHGNASLAKSPHWSPMAENTPKRTSELPLGNIHPQLHQRMEAASYSLFGESQLIVSHFKLFKSVVRVIYGSATFASSTCDQC